MIVTFQPRKYPERLLGTGRLLDFRKMSNQDGYYGQDVYSEDQNSLIF